MKRITSLRALARAWPVITSAGVTLLWTVAGCVPEDKPVSETWLAMGTFASVHVPAPDQRALSHYAGEARDLLAELEELLSIYRPESELSRLNREGALAAQVVSEHTSRVLEAATNYAYLTRGAFDPTVAPLVRLWGFNNGRVCELPPDAQAIESNRRMVGWVHLVVSNRWAKFEHAGMSVDLGGIAKGYAVDLCYERLRKLGARNFMVNLGGNIRCAGIARRNGSWKIGVRNPFRRDRIVGTLSMSNGLAVATSGNYERFVEIGGQRYTHIIDPRTGWPVQGMAAVTVLATTATEADALSTGLFVLGPDEGSKVVAQLGDCHALFIPDQAPLRILITPGLRRYFTPAAEYAGSIEILGSLRNFK